MRKLDLTNQRFNKLVALEYSHKKGSKVMWKCRCDCGNITYVSVSNLRCNRVISCGCYKLEEFSKRFTKHNQRHTKLYEIWKSMKRRCFNSKNAAFHNYGGRGITVCDDWANDFSTFYVWSMQNGYSEGLSIDRIDNNGNYEPSNCRWVDKLTQANNTRANHFVSYNGQKLTVAQLSKKTNMPYQTLLHRINKGWTIEKAITTPIKKR